MKIEINNVSKSFKNVEVLSNVNLEFESGKIYGFIGKNGCGKSVLLKLITGYLNPSSGDILYDSKKLGTDIKIPPSTRCLIESPSFISSISGFKNLKILADIKGLITDEEILKSLSNVNLIDEKDKAYYKYSLGMKQKLGLAQVFMENPEVIVIDEPFNGVEQESIEKIRNLLLDEKSKGKLIIIATHIKEDIDKLCDITYTIIDGEVSLKE